MGTFDKTGAKVLNYLQKGNGWVRRENISPKDIEVCGGEATADETTNTCELCVALNRTVFQNNNKPEYTHPNCKCEQVPTSLDEPELDFRYAKMIYLFDKKGDWMRSMGYVEEDGADLYRIISENAKKQFMQGNYILDRLNQHGQRVDIILVLPGKRDKQRMTYRVKTGWTAFPNGKLHNNTPIGGWAK